MSTSCVYVCTWYGHYFAQEVSTITIFHVKERVCTECFNNTIQSFVLKHPFPYDVVPLVSFEAMFVSRNLNLPLNAILEQMEVW